MPSTPSHLKLGFHRNAYNRVSFGRKKEPSRNLQEQNTELLQGCKEAPHGLPPLKPGVDYINPGEEDQMEVYGYQRQPVLTAITWVFILATGGLLRLVFHWWPHGMLMATHRRCSLDIATKVLVVEMYKQKHKCYYVKRLTTLTAETLKVGDGKTTPTPDNWDDQALADIHQVVGGKLSIHLTGGTFKELDMLRIFHCKKLCYVWDEERSEFLRLAGLDKDVNTSTLHQQQGLTVEEQTLRRAVYGTNEIIVPVRSILTLLFLEVLNPFYVFQLFSFCLWFADNYIYYAVAILLMSAFGITMAIIQTRKNQFNLRSTVHSSDVATVVRGATGQRDTVPTEQLVPGDLLVVPPHGCIMHCDAVLLTGNCIVNESMLTGESVPVTKTPVPNATDTEFDSKEHARHTLFCGTHVIQTRYYGNELVLAVVVRTGFSTAKGSLVRSIMYPPPVDFKFEHDSYRFVELLAAIASIGFVYTVITKSLRGISWSEIVVESLDLITIVVPPALPAAMTVGRFYAQKRLKAKDVYCISPRTINVSGSIDCVCFDKTGTLTEDGLDMWGVVPVLDSSFQVPVKQMEQLPLDQLLTGMVTCHSITIIEGKLCGDPLDLKMFESTGWQLEEPEVNDNSKFDMIFPTVVKPPQEEGVTVEDTEQMEPPLEIGIVRQFPFTSGMQRMSVIARTLGATNFQLYCKGSPEMILTLVRPETVPTDFSSVLEEYTQEGYRVIALACRDLPRMSYAKVQRLTRQDCERDLTMLGLLVMENRLKPGTSAVIGGLRDANIRTIMVTGDNMLTALSVGRDCGIIPMGQRVIVATGVTAQVDKPAQLCFTNTNCHLPPPSIVVGGGDRSTVSSKSTSLQSVECGSPSSSGGAASYCFAMTGRTWALVKLHFPEVVPRLVTRGAVFARMNPDQKQQLVLELQQLGYYVAMCGDGANDCGALKAAHTGISLSEAESSVASPFTSKVADISCVPRVIREGRAALVTSFGIFKYMAAYSLTQFVSVMILYSLDTNLTDIQFLYIDLFLITTFAFFFGRTEAFEGPLVPSPPILSLISLTPVVSLLLQLALVILLQWVSLSGVQSAEWFVPHNATAGMACYENYALFSTSSFQYIILALVFSKGPPYRKSVFSNHGFLGSILVLLAFSLYLALGPAKWLQQVFELQVPPEMGARLLIVGLGAANLMIAAVLEYVVVDYLLLRKVRYRWHNVDKSKRKFLAIERDMAGSSWPPIDPEPPQNRAPDPPPPRSPATVSEVALTPSSLLGSKRRHYSETNGYCVQNETNMLVEPKRRHHSDINGYYPHPNSSSLPATGNEAISNTIPVPKYLYSKTNGSYPYVGSLPRTANEAALQSNVSITLGQKRLLHGEMNGYCMTLPHISLNGGGNVARSLVEVHTCVTPDPYKSVTPDLYKSVTPDPYRGVTSDPRC